MQKWFYDHLRRRGGTDEDDYNDHHMCCDHHYGWVARNATLLEVGEGQVKCFCYAKLSAQE